MEAGQYPQACPHLEASYNLDPAPGTVYAWASCDDKWGQDHVADAVALYNKFLDMYARMPTSQQTSWHTQKETAEERVKALSPLVAQLTLTLPRGAPTGTLVKLNGNPLPLGSPRPMNPGKHVVTTEAPGGPVTPTPVTLAPGDKKTIILKVTPAPDETSDSSTPKKASTAAIPGMPQVHIETKSPVILMALNSTDRDFDNPLCQSPCDRAIDGRFGQEFFFTGNGITESSRFDLRYKTGKVTMDVNPGSSALRVGGIILTTMGIGGAAAGGVMLALPKISTAISPTWSTVGGTALGVGGATLIGGIIMIVASRTTYSIRDGAIPGVIRF